MTTPTLISPEAERTINETIARWMGWTDITLQHLDRRHHDDCVLWPHGNPPGFNGSAANEVPRFTRDLNAIALAEIRLSDEQHRRFRLYLIAVFAEKDESEFHNRSIVSASALDRSRALCRVIENASAEL